MSNEARKRFLEHAQEAYGIDARKEVLKRGLGMVIADLDTQIKRFDFMSEDFPRNDNLREIQEQIRDIQRMTIEERNKLF